VRATFELEPAGSAAALAALESTGLRNGPESVRATVVDERDGLATIELAPESWEGDVTTLVSMLVAGEWSEIGAFTRCRLVGVEWPEGVFPGPAFGAQAGVAVGAIVKPSLGLSPAEVAETAAALAHGGATLIKDDELLGDRTWCPLEERVRAVSSALPDGAAYAPNVSGPVEGLLGRAERAVERGAGAVMVNVVAQGFDGLRLLREAGLGVPLFAHRVGAALWTRGEQVGVSGAVLTELTRLLGADYVQVGSFTGKLAGNDDDVRAQIDACRGSLGEALTATAVISGGIGPLNAAHSVTAAGTRDGLLLMVGSAAYEHPGGPAEGVRATVEAVGR
jgi:ribulose-bisphosphate carboxylase large chain